MCSGQPFHIFSHSSFSAYDFQRFSCVILLTFSHTVCFKTPDEEDLVVETLCCFHHINHSKGDCTVCVYSSFFDNLFVPQSDKTIDKVEAIHKQFLPGSIKYDVRL